MSEIEQSGSGYMMPPWVKYGGAVILGAIITIVVIMLMNRSYSKWSEWSDCENKIQHRTRSAKGFSNKTVTLDDLQQTTSCGPAALSEFSYEDCNEGKKVGTRAIEQAGTGLLTDEKDLFLRIVEPCQDDLFGNRKTISSATFIPRLNFDKSGNDAFSLVNKQDTFVLIDEFSRIHGLSLEVPKGTTMKFYRKLTPVRLPTESDIGDLNIVAVQSDNNETSHYNQVDEGKELWKSFLSDDHLVFEHTFTENVPDLPRYLASLPEFKDLKYPHAISENSAPGEIKQIDATAIEIPYDIKDSNGVDMVVPAGTTLVHQLVVKVVIPEPTFDFSEREPRVEMKSFGYTEPLPSIGNMRTFDRADVRDTPWGEFILSHDADTDVFSAYLIPSDKDEVVVVKDGKIAASYGTFYRETTMKGRFFDHSSLSWQVEQIEIPKTDTPYSFDFANLLLDTIAERRPEVSLTNIDLLATFSVHPVSNTLSS